MSPQLSRFFQRILPSIWLVAICPGAVLVNQTASRAAWRGHRTSSPIVAVHEAPFIRVECGGAEDTQGIASAIAAAKGAPIVISNGETCAVDDLVIPNLRIELGGLLKPLAGRTVTLSGNFDAGIYQVFANAVPGQGTIVFKDASIIQIYAQWWGAKGDPSVDDTGALNAALAQRGQRLFLPGGRYKITANLAPPQASAIIGAGRDQSVLLPARGVTEVLKVSTRTPVLENFGIDGSATIDATGIMFGDAKSLGAWGGRAMLLRLSNFKGPRGVGLRVADTLKAEFTSILSEDNGTAMLVRQATENLPTTKCS